MTDFLCLLLLDGHLYAGAVVDFSGLDPGIHRDGSLRTEQFDLKQLNGKQLPKLWNQIKRELSCF